MPDPPPASTTSPHPAPSDRPEKAPSPYLLATGAAGAARLKVLSAALEPTTRAFLLQAGIQGTVRCLDLGCGSGEVTRLIAELSDGATVVGLDNDPLVVAIATRMSNGTGYLGQDARSRSHGTAGDRDSRNGRAGVAGSADLAPNRRVSFAVADATALPDQLPGGWDVDLVYSRFLLSHLRDPVALLQTLASRCRPGTVVAVEDVDFAGHRCVPQSWAFDRYVSLYQAAARTNTTDPCIGPTLPALFCQAGLVDVRESAVLPEFTEGDGKLVASLTLAQIGPSLVARALATAEELRAVQLELDSLAADHTTSMSTARVVQVVGRVPSG